MKSVRTRCAGAAAVEFALVFPLIVATLIVFIDLIFVMHNYAVLTNAAREGARRGIVYNKPRPPYSEIEAKVTAYASSNVTGYDASKLTVAATTTNAACTTTSCSCIATNDYLTVKATYNGGASNVMYGIYKVAMGNIQLTASTTMRCE